APRHQSVVPSRRFLERSGPGPRGRSLPCECEFARSRSPPRRSPWLGQLLPNATAHGGEGLTLWNGPTRVKRTCRLAESWARPSSIPHPEVDLPRGRARLLEVALLPGVVVHETFPALALGLGLPPEAPAVLVVNRHDVRGVGGREPGRVSDDE